MYDLGSPLSFIGNSCIINLQKIRGGIRMKKMIEMLKRGYINLMMGGVGFANACAMAAMTSSVNTACIWAHHQPKVPEEAKSFRKF